MKRKWCEQTVEKDWQDGDVAQKEGSGRSKSVRTEENIRLVGEITLSQEDQARNSFYTSRNCTWT